MTEHTRNLMRAFLHGFTGAGLFRRLDYPGAPAEFIDSRTPEEIHASGEFDRNCNAYNAAKLCKQRDDARRGRAAVAAISRAEEEGEVALRH